MPLQHLSSVMNYIFQIQELMTERLPVALMALVLAALAGIVTGPVRGNANPFLWLVADGLFGRLGRRLDRPERPRSSLTGRGTVLTVGVLVLFWQAGVAAEETALLMPFYSISEIIFLSLALAGGAVWYALLRLYFGMKPPGSGKGAYYAIARTTRIDLSAADEFSITRAGMGLAARSFDKGAVAPVLWYLIAGLPGAYLYAALAALAWRFGRDGHSGGFGVAPLALEKLAGFVPSVCAGILLALAGLFTPTGGMTRALAGLSDAKNRVPYEEGGLPVQAMAHALETGLGGPATDIDGIVMKRGWAGPPGATAQLEPWHLQRAIYLSVMAYLLLIAGLAGAMFFGFLSS